KIWIELDVIDARAVSELRFAVAFDLDFLRRSASFRRHTQVDGASITQRLKRGLEETIAAIIVRLVEMNERLALARFVSDLDARQPVERVARVNELGFINQLLLNIYPFNLEGKLELLRAHGVRRGRIIYVEDLLEHFVARIARRYPH